MASTPHLATKPDGWYRTLIENGGLAAALGLITLMAWFYLVYQSWAMDHMDLVDMAMPGMLDWGVRDLAIIFTMWTVMMVGMMAPSASPMVLLFARIQKERHGHGRPMVAGSLFLLGYLLVWTGFSLAATLIQWALHNTMLISPMMVGTNPLLGGALLVAAGIYQWTPAKEACLMRCRSPLGFLLTEWRDGASGALVMGLRHGLFCTGCCWMLMLILFVVGVMNLLWLALLTAFVLLEKTLPQGRWMTRASSLALITWGIWMWIARPPLT